MGLFSRNDKFKDPFEKNMVKVCAGMLAGGFVYGDWVLEHPGGDKRKKEVYCKHLRHRDLVVNKEFMISKYLVTQKQWKMVMGEGFNPVRWEESLGDDKPVYGFDKKQLDEFLAKLNKLTGKKYRIPTEDEWMWAAYGASKDKDRSEYAGCKSADDLPKYAWFNKNSDYKLHPVGKKKSNELGLYDMCGNMDDLCACTQKRYLYYGWYSNDGPVYGWVEDGDLVNRGGHYSSNSKECSIYSDTVQIDIKYNAKWSGFRLALDV